MDQILYFHGRIESLNANIFGQIDRTDDDILAKVSSAVAKFYVILRNIAAIVMLAGLIFTGIRILLSANIPTKKAQWLTYLQDWIIGMVLLIFSHIIMILIFEVAKAFVNALGDTIAGESLKWQLIAMMGGSFDSSSQLIALILYHWVQWQTIVFAIAYFKRYFWTCILTIFAPVMCVMYAFGQQTKQIYSNWLREYILNAFVQPFHMIVYTVLVGIPLGITSGGGWNWSYENTSEVAYALMGITMIRPAEKYLRRLFGMDKGIANMASYDSGKQVVDGAVKAVAAVAKTAAAIYTGGASAAAGAALSSGAGAAASGALGSAGSSLGGALGEASGDLGDAGNVLNEAGDTLGELGDGTGDSPWISEGWETDTQGRFLNPYNDEWYTEAELTAGRDLPSYMDQDDFSDGDIQALAQGIGEQTEKSGENGTSLNAANITIGSANVEMGVGDSLGQFGSLPLGAMGDDGQGMLGENGDGIAELEKEKKSLSSQQGNLTRRINALDKEEQKLLPSDDDWMYSAHMENGMEGNEDDPKEQRLRALREERAGLVSQRDGVIARKGEISDQISEMKENNSGENNTKQIPSQGNNSSVKGGSGNLSAGNITINASSVNLAGGKTDSNSNNGAIKAEVANKVEKDETITQKTEMSLDDGISLTGEIGDFGDIFKSLGGLEKIGELGVDLFEGLHSLTDGLYVDGTAPTNEWKSNAQWARGNIKEAGEKRKENIKIAQDNWANNKQNIKTMSDHYYVTKYLPEMKQKYGDTRPQGYIEAQAREKADTKAKNALKDMSAYVPYGVTDVKVAYQLYENANKNGLSPEQSIRNQAGYNKFNSNVQNVAQINLSTAFTRNDYTTVEQAIPNARTYYDAGYTNVNEMAWVEYMAEKLGRSPEFAMRVDETLRKNGKGSKISYNGKDADMKKVIDQINSHYGG